MSMSGSVPRAPGELEIDAGFVLTATVLLTVIGVAVIAAKLKEWLWDWD